MTSTSISTFQRVLSAFKTRLSSEEVELFQITTLDDLKVAIKSIQKEQAARKNLRNLNRIRPFLDGLTQYAEVIEVFVQVKPDILGFIWGPIKLCLQIASKLNEAFDILLDAYESIGTSFPTLSTVNKLFYGHPHVNQVLADIFEDILDFHKRAIVFFKYPTWKLSFKLAYNTFDNNFGDILKKLQRSRDLLLQSASIAHFEESQEVRIQFTELQSKIMAEFQKSQEDRLYFTKQLELLLEEEKNKKSLVVLDWLSTDSKSAVQHEELREIRSTLLETTRWIFFQPPMRHWIERSENSPCNFWLCGIPGAGKTVIFNSVIDEISRIFPRTQVIYFYCKSNDPHRSNFENLAKELLAQIFQLNPNCLDFLYESILKSRKRRPKTASMLLEILEQVLVNHDSLYIGIDGLDECEESGQKSLFELIELVNRTQNTQRNLQLLVTSRKEKVFEKILSSATKFEITPSMVKGDINAYITLKVFQLSQKFKFRNGREQKITEEICTRPKGMFLLARLIMDNLLDQDTLEDLDEELISEVLPHGIEEAYYRMLVRIGKGNAKGTGAEKRQRRAHSVLQLITMARRALYVHEIQGSLAVNLEQQIVDWEGRQSKLPIDELCGPIVEVHKSGLIEMVHPTARDYLLQYHSGPYIDAIVAEEDIATLCASYLTFECFDPAILNNEQDRFVSHGYFAFQDYAVCYWLHHSKSLLQQIKVENSSILWNKTLALVNHHRRQIGEELLSEVSSQQELLDSLHKLQERYEGIDTIHSKNVDKGMVYLLSQISKVRAFIESQVQPGEIQENLTRSYGQSRFRCPVLHCPNFITGFASLDERDKHHDRHKREHLCTDNTCDYHVLGFASENALDMHTKLCHENSPKDPIFPLIKSRSLEKALDDAIKENDLLSIKTLAAEVAASPQRKKGFLLDALMLKHIDAAEILLEFLGSDSEIDHRDKRDNSAILKLCEFGEYNFLDKIISTYGEGNLSTITEFVKNSKISRTTTDTHHPLCIAAENGHAQVVELLLRQKCITLAECEYISYRIKGPLILACKKGHLGVVLLLLEKESEFYSSKLTAGVTRAIDTAAKEKHRPVVQLLVDWALRCGPKALPRKVRNNQNRNKDKDTITDIILKGYELVDEKGKTRDNVLQSAALKGDTDQINFLLDLGADINNTESHYGTALMAASTEGQMDAVKLLLDRGADFMLRSSVRYSITGSAVDCAAAYGHEPIVRILLDRGAKFDPKCKCNNKEKLGFIHSRTIYLWNPLQLASSIPRATSCMRLLLDSGIDADCMLEGSTKTPLQISIIEENEAGVDILLEYGAEVNLQVPSTGNTAMHTAVETGSIKSLRLLLKHKADVNIADNNNITPLMKARKLKDLQLSQEIQQALIDGGAHDSIEECVDQVVNLEDSSENDLVEQSNLWPENPIIPSFDDVVEQSRLWRGNPIPAFDDGAGAFEGFDIGEGTFDWAEFDET